MDNMLHHRSAASFAASESILGVRRHGRRIGWILHCWVCLVFANARQILWLQPTSTLLMLSRSHVVVGHVASLGALRTRRFVSLEVARNARLLAFGYNMSDCDPLLPVWTQVSKTHFHCGFLQHSSFAACMHSSWCALTTIEWAAALAWPVASFNQMCKQLPTTLDNRMVQLFGSPI